MKKYAAFLRAINVGGHTVKMDYLKSLFEDLDFKNVETFIASGNVIFESAESNKVKMENQIENYLLENLGYETITFIRNISEFKEIINYKAFTQKKYDEAVSNNIGFIKKPLDSDSLKILKSLETDNDDFNTFKTEVYWICKTGQSKSTFSGNLFERKLKKSITIRGLKTIKRLNEEYS